MASFAYIDETGTSSLTDPRQPILTLVAAVIEETQVQALDQSMRNLVMSALGWRPADFEFHGSELFHGSGHWATRTASQLIAAYERALSLLAVHQIRIAHASINKPRLIQQYPNADSPYLLALQFLAEKIHRRWPNERKVLVADESKEHELQAIRMVADLQQWGTGIVPGPRLTSIIDSLHFVKSEASPGVQIADMVGFIIQRHRDSTEPHPEATEAVGRMRAMIRNATATWREIWPSA